MQTMGSLSISNMLKMNDMVFMLLLFKQEVSVKLMRLLGVQGMQKQISCRTCRLFYERHS